MTRWVSRSSHLLALLCLMQFAGIAAAETRNLLVHGSAERYWIVRIEQETAGGYASPAGATATLRSVVLSRRLTGPWKQIARLSLPIVSVAHRGTQLAALLDNGQWMLLWDGGSTVGPLPEDGAKLVYLTSDGQHLFAVGATGIGPPPTSAGATQPSATLPARTRMLYRLDDRGEWVSESRLPDAAQDGKLSLDMSGDGLLLAAARGGGPVDIFHYDLDARQWSPFGTIDVGDATVIQLLPDLNRPTLYAGDAAGRGAIYARGDDWTGPIPLELPADAPSATASGIGVAMNSIRLDLVNARNGITEYAFSKIGQMRGSPTELSSPIKPPEENELGWLSMMAMALLAIMVVNSMRRRDPLTSEEIEDAGLRIAPHGQRLLAAVIDALPVIVTFTYLYANYEVDELLETKQLEAYLSVLAYLLHTLIFELIFGWSIGKKLADLRVVMADGAKPTAKALLIRNLLRVVDLALPLAMLLVVISPLHQRVGDVAAETIVVTGQPKQQQSGAEEET
jgi:uncharacterized RDD family membrane protein YckC